MKNFKLFISIVFIFALVGFNTGCTKSSDDSLYGETHYILQDNSNPMDEFDYQLDLYNQTFYCNDSSDSIQTRGFWTECLSTVAGSTVDSAGGFIGSHIGKYIGGAVGSLSANPVGTFVGYVGGRYVGKHVGSVMSSAVWNIAVGYVTHNYVFKSATPFKCVYQADFNIKMSKICDDIMSKYAFTEKADSLGHFHNELMSKFCETGLFEQTAEFDFDKFYEAVVPLIENQLNIKINIHEDMIQYGILKSFFTKFYSDVINCANNNISLSEFSERVKNMINSTYPMTEQDVYIMDSVIRPITQKIQNMSIPQIQEYSKGLNGLILNSRLSDEMKAEVAYHTQILINSALIWQ